MRANEWVETLKRIASRWNGFTPDGANLEDWHAALHGHPYEFVDEALKRVRLKYSSAEPALKWIVEALNNVEQERRPPSDDRPPAPPRAKMLADVKTLDDDQIAWLHRYALCQDQMIRVRNPELDPETWDRFALHRIWYVAQTFHCFDDVSAPSPI